MKIWKLEAPLPHSAAKQAGKAESDGWSGVGLTDSQNLAGDSWVTLTAMANASEHLELGTSVTNPVTRHPAVTAAAAQALAIIAGDRVAVGIGRGDSALAHLGRAPAGVGLFERYLRALRTYLRGEPVQFDDLSFSEATAPDVATLGLADSPKHSRLVWRRANDPTVTVEVASTGPKVIAAAARSADRIVFALGAAPERIAWGIETARAARIDAGLDPDDLEFASFLNVVPHTDIDAARTMVAGGLSTFARFAVMHGTVHGPADESQRELMERLRASYDMKSHTRTDSDQTRALTPEFIDHYSIVGPATHCVARLQELESLGLSKVIVIGPSLGSDRNQAAESYAEMVGDVLPAFSGGN